MRHSTGLATDFVVTAFFATSAAFASVVVSFAAAAVKARLGQRAKIEDGGDSDGGAISKPTFSFDDDVSLPKRTSKKEGDDKAPSATSSLEYSKDTTKDSSDSTTKDASTATSLAYSMDEETFEQYGSQNPQRDGDDFNDGDGNGKA